MTDQQLLTNFVSDRDEAAFEAVVLRYGPMVLRVCRDVLEHPADAEDAFQATFLVLFRQAGSIRDRASLGRWLCEVAWRISRRERRRVARLRSQERQALEMNGEARSDYDPADREIKPVLQDEIRRLPSKLRDPILLCYFEGLTVEAAARQLRVPVGTLKSRLVKGREQLRSRLTRRGLAASAMLLLMFSLTEEVPAAVPSRLVESTVEAGLRGSSGSRRVAAMVMAEESRRPWIPLGPYWALLIGGLVVFGAIKLASARIIHVAPNLAPMTSGTEAPPTSGTEAPSHCGSDAR
jgi:RNA polymerase sigma factor (sigma-70 family)